MNMPAPQPKPVVTDRHHFTLTMQDIKLKQTPMGWMIYLGKGQGLTATDAEVVLWQHIQHKQEQAKAARKARKAATNGRR
jgi:hypothetical protein